jgi:L-serine dehydratase
MRNATVAGAEGGCQAECGTAAAMAAAACVQLKGGSAVQMVNAAALALVNVMGLVCDPVAGLVQLPCSFRNASGAVNALLSADLALAGQAPGIPPDEVVDAMYRTGRKLPLELRETALGGMAAEPAAKQVAKQLQQGQA